MNPGCLSGDRKAHDVLVLKEMIPGGHTGEHSLELTFAAVITFLIRIGPEHFEWGIVAALLIGGAVAAPTAARVCHRTTARALGILIGATLMVLNARTLILSLF